MHLFWEQLKLWIYSKTGLVEEFTKENIYLRFKKSNNDPIFVIILITKQLIFKNHMKYFIPNVTWIQKELVLYYYITKSIAFGDCNYNVCQVLVRVS